MESYLIRPAAGIVRDTLLETSFRSATGIQSKRIQPFLPRDFTQLELLPDLSLDDLVQHTSWQECCRFLHRRVVWMGREVYLCLQRKGFDSFPWVLCVGTPASSTTRPRGYPLTVYVHAPDPAAASSICDFLVRLVAAHSEQRHVRIAAQCFGTESFPVSGSALAHYFGQHRIDLQSFTLSHIKLNEGHLRALASVSRHAMDLNLEKCSLSDDTGSRDAFVECLQSGRGPTKLDRCSIDCSVLADALTTMTVKNTHLARPTKQQDATDDNTGKGNATGRGIEELNLDGCFIRAENWSILAKSLKTHPTITRLSLSNTRPRISVKMSHEERKCRTLALAEMLQDNTVLHTICLQEDESDSHVYVESIEPRLEMNLYSPLVAAIKRIDARFRRALLGKALQSESVRNRPNIIRMFLSGNADVVV
jgi:hypothetical protein